VAQGEGPEFKLQYHTHKKIIDYSKSTKKAASLLGRGVQTRLVRDPAMQRQEDRKTLSWGGSGNVAWTKRERLSWLHGLVLRRLCKESGARSVDDEVGLGVTALSPQ
jgi:hypothetical protein